MTNPTLLAAVWLAALSGPELAKTGAPGLAAIRAADLSAHIRFLADDLLEGRAPGTPGHAVAARYLATQLQAAGAEPAGGKGSWFQSVPLVALQVDPARCAFSVAGPGGSWNLSLDRDVMVGPTAVRPDAEVSGELVFAGHGVEASPYGYDDAPKDLRGKIAVVLSRAPISERPDFFPSAASAVFGEPDRKSRLLAARGAVAIVSVLTPESLEVYSWERRVNAQRAFESMEWMEGATPGSGSPVPTAQITPEAFDRLLEKAGRRERLAGLLQLSQSGRLQPFALGGLTGRLRTAARVRSLRSDNVVGVLRGSDPARSGEYVVYTAHLDHVGIGPAVDGDAIYNGAIDDAGGVASLIAIARAFAALPSRPPRSILLLGVTAEEKGLLGSEYFVAHPTVPLGAIVADINSDGPTGWWRPHDVVVLGGEHSSLGQDARAAAAALGLTVSPDPAPEQTYFVRSDQYSFVQKGIPAVFPGVGARDAAGETKANDAVSRAWIATHYHRPSDEWDPKADYENMAIEVRFYFLIGLSVATERARPAWNPGDVFGKIFASPASGK